VVSRDLERLYRKRNFPDFPTASPGFVGYPDEHSCDETNVNFELRVTGDISRENAVKPNDVFVCVAELKSASDVLLSPLKTNSNSSVLISPVKTNSNLYRSSAGIQGY